MNCYAGAAGTYVNYLNTGSSLNNAVLAINNRDIATFATTVVNDNDVLSTLRGFAVLADAAVASTAISLEQQCDMSVSCHSFIALDNSRIVSLVQGPQADSMLSLQADSIEFSKGSSIGSAFHLTVSAQLVAVDMESTMNFGCYANITSTRYMEVLSALEQVYYPEVCHNASSQDGPFGLVISGQNVSISSARAQNLAVNSDELFVTGSFVGVPEEYNLTSCWDPVDTFVLSCENFDENSTLQLIPSNTLNYVIIITDSDFTLAPGTTMAASVVLVCSPVIVLHPDSMVTTDGRGCQYNDGYGAGTPPASEGTGGGGGGFGGMGGAGSASAPGGQTFPVGFNLSVGYGGGAAYDLVPYRNASAGGGLIVINGSYHVELEGTLRSCGGHASEDGGGGSGGMVQLYTLMLGGNGSVIVDGGAGGPEGGGGGGGGIINIDNLDSSATYDFKGVISYTGGSALVQQSSIYEVLYPEPGGAGKVGWPICIPGYGNDYDTFKMCYKCPVDYYKQGYNGNECKKCENKPHHSAYTTPGWTTKECRYECDSGFVGDNCVAPFERFIDGMGGYPVFAASAAGILFVVFAPLLILRMRKKYRQKQIMEESESSKSQVFGNMADFHQEKTSEWLNPVLDETLLTENDPSREEYRPSAATPSPTSSKKCTHARRHAAYSSKRCNLLVCVAVGGVLRSLRDGATFPELRALCRMADKDLPHHAARVYLWGNNSPFATDGRRATIYTFPISHFCVCVIIGGPWYWPLQAPPSLAGMIHAKDYSTFAEFANSMLHWDSLGWEAVLFGILSVLLPPYADSFMVRMCTWNSRTCCQVRSLIAMYTDAMSPKTRKGIY